jgi:hypothetical protein
MDAFDAVFWRITNVQGTSLYEQTLSAQTLGFPTAWTSTFLGPSADHHDEHLWCVTSRAASVFYPLDSLLNSKVPVVCEFQNMAALVHVLASVIRQKQRGDAQKAAMGWSYPISTLPLISIPVASRLQAAEKCRLSLYLYLQI